MPELNGINVCIYKIMISVQVLSTHSIFTHLTALFHHFFNLQFYPWSLCSEDEKTEITHRS